ncbi:MAG: HD domain-containing protein [Bacteroidia bacterium]|nr:HD domain-containing protein [Bacteroidia bacterium]
MYSINGSMDAAELEKRAILSRYKALYQSCKHFTKNELKSIRKAFDFANKAHKDIRRKSGEPYIFHPIAVAEIVAKEIGLDATSVICALLHDVIEDTVVEEEDIRREFGDTVLKIILGLTKISGVFEYESEQAENFRRMLLTMSDDIRVILIKFADRLHNMRTLEHMQPDKRLKIASETLFLYAPLAGRLGLYNIKTELEDLSFKFTEPEEYNKILSQMRATRFEREKFIQEFIAPLKLELMKTGLNFEIKGRTKSIYSIYRKMQTQNIPFDQVFDLFAIRIIIDIPEPYIREMVNDKQLEEIITAQRQREKDACFKIYNVITSLYHSNPNRLRDWINTPKANGYEALHTTVMSKTGRWVEIQIRTRRMDDIAERGLAAHWKYKEKSQANTFDKLVSDIRDMISLQKNHNAEEFVSDFKLNFFTDEIYTFTPKGKMLILPKNATVLDFAYEIHGNIGNRCIGAKVNNKLVGRYYVLSNGDQVEILTSDKQQPEEEWINFVKTAKAISFIKDAIKARKKQIAEKGYEMLTQKLKLLNIEPSQKNLSRMLIYFKISDLSTWNYMIGSGRFPLHLLDEYAQNPDLKKKKIVDNSDNKSISEIVKRLNKDLQTISSTTKNIDFEYATCCNPIPGDSIVGFYFPDKGIEVHQIKCEKAIELMSHHGNRIVNLKWNEQHQVAFLAGLKINGADRIGIVRDITNVISAEEQINMRSINLESNGGIFEGTLMLYIQDTKQLEYLTEKLEKIEGILSVSRFDSHSA